MKRNYKKYIKLFLPRLAFDNLHYRLSLLKPDFDYDITIFYSILNDLNTVKYSEDHSKKNGMTPMYSKYLQKKYGNNYNRYIRYLSNNSVIYGSTNKKNQCSYYGLVLNSAIEEMLNKEYYSNTYSLQNYELDTIQLIDHKEFIGVEKVVKKMQVVEVKIPITSKVGKYIISQYNKETDRIKHSAPHIKAMQSHFLNNIKIDYENAIQHTINFLNSEIAKAGEDIDLQKKANEKYRHRVNSCIGISLGKKERGLRFTRTKNTGRIETNLTNLSKDLRPFLLGYDKLSYLDLCNSQPVLFNILLNKHYSDKKPKLKKEIDLYRKHTLSGHWYEFLMEIYKVSRDETKTIWMTIAYSENSECKLFKRRFAKQFPEIMKLIEKKKQKQYNQFAIELQLIESNVFIDEICKALVEQGIIPYTIHDGLLVPKEREAETYNVMVEVLKKHLGTIPVISVNEKKIFPAADDKNYTSAHI